MPRETPEAVAVRNRRQTSTPLPEDVREGKTEQSNKQIASYKKVNRANSTPNPPQRQERGVSLCAKGGFCTLLFCCLFNE